MSLLAELQKEKMSVGDQLKKNTHHIQLIHINDIRPNSLNFFHIFDEEVKALAYELEKRGVNNGRVYYEDVGDGKHYTLVGGETRYRALCLLYKEGKHDGLFPMYIVEKPEDEIEEVEMIMGDNHQRFLSEDDKRIIIQNYEKIYEYYKEKDKKLDKQIAKATNSAQIEYLEEKREIPKGMSKRDWIATKTKFTNRNGTNITGRQVQQYLTGKYSGKSSVRQKQSSEQSVEQEVLNKLKRYLVNLIDTNISISSTKLTIQFANIYDLHRILQILKEDEHLDVITSAYVRKNRRQ